MSIQGESRFRAWLQFAAALIWFFVARSMAHRGAFALASESLQPVAEMLFLAFFLIFGYSGLGAWLNGQKFAISQQGLMLRDGWQRETGIGLAFGWAVALLCVLPLALGSGIAVTLSLQGRSWAWLAVDAAYFLLFALAEEVAFRGYGFQRFLQATGTWSGSLTFALIYALVQAQVPGSTRVSFLVSMALNLLLSLAYLRTRALWVSWGLNFGWKASRALLFGLAVSGNIQHSPVVQGDPMGSFWMTGGGFGLDGSWVSLGVLLLALPFLYKATRELDFRYNAPVLIPGGMAVDLDAAARKMHDQAMAPVTPAAPALVQILPAAPVQTAPLPIPQATPEQDSIASKS